MQAAKADELEKRKARAKRFELPVADKDEARFLATMPLCAPSCPCLPWLLLSHNCVPDEMQHAVTCGSRIAMKSGFLQ